MLESFIDYNPIKNVYKNKKTNVLLNAREFYKGRRNVLIAFEENIFPLPKPYVFRKNEWKEKNLGAEKYMLKTFDLIFLLEYNQTLLSEKENELLNRDFGYKNIGELAFAFNNTKTDEERNELLEQLNTLKMLVKIASRETEKERINNVMKSVKFVLDYAASFDDSKQDFSGSDFSDTKVSGLKLLTPNQMFSSLPITLAQLKAGNSSEKLKNEIRQLLYSLYRSKKLQSNSIKV